MSSSNSPDTPSELQVRVQYLSEVQINSYNHASGPMHPDDVPPGVKQLLADPDVEYVLVGHTSETKAASLYRRIDPPRPLPLDTDQETPV